MQHQQPTAGTPPVFRQLQGKMPMMPQLSNMSHPMESAPQPLQRPVKITRAPMHVIPPAGNGMYTKVAFMASGSQQGGLPISPYRAGSPCSGDGQAVPPQVVRISNAVGKSSFPPGMMRLVGNAAVEPAQSRQGLPSSVFYASTLQGREGPRNSGTQSPKVGDAARPPQTLSPSGEKMTQQQHSTMRNPILQLQSPPLSGRATQSKAEKSDGFWGSLKKNATELFGFHRSEKLNKKSHEDKSEKISSRHDEKENREKRREVEVHLDEANRMSREIRSASQREALNPAIKAPAAATAATKAPAAAAAAAAVTKAPAAATAVTKAPAAETEATKAPAAATGATKAPAAATAVTKAPAAATAVTKAPAAATEAAKAPATVPVDSGDSERLVVSPTAHIQDKIKEAGVAPSSVICFSKESEESHQKSLKKQRVLGFPSLVVIDSDEDISNGTKETENHNRDLKPKGGELKSIPADSDSKSEGTPEQLMRRMTSLSSASNNTGSPDDIHLTNLPLSQQHKAVREKSPGTQTVSTQHHSSSDFPSPPPPQSVSSSNKMTKTKKSLPELLKSDGDSIAASKEYTSATPMRQSRKQAPQATSVDGGRLTSAASKGEEKERPVLSSSLAFSVPAHTLRQQVASESEEKIGTRRVSPHVANVSADVKMESSHRELRKHRTPSSSMHRVSPSSSSSSSSTRRHHLGRKAKGHQDRTGQGKGRSSCTSSQFSEPPDEKKKENHCLHRERIVISPRHVSSRGCSPKPSGQKGRKTPLYSPDAAECSRTDGVLARHCSVSTPTRTHGGRAQRRDVAKSDSSSKGNECRTCRSPFSSLFRVADVYQLYKELKRQEGQLHRDRVPCRRRERKAEPGGVANTSSCSSSNSKDNVSSVTPPPRKPHQSHTRKDRQPLQVRDHSPRPWRHNSLHLGPLISTTPLRRPLGYIGFGDGQYRHIDHRRRSGGECLQVSRSQSAYHTSSRASPMWMTTPHKRESRSSSQPCRELHNCTKKNLHPYEVVSFRWRHGGREPQKNQKSINGNGCSSDGDLTERQHLHQVKNNNKKDNHWKLKQEEDTDRLSTQLLSPGEGNWKPQGHSEVKPRRVVSLASARLATVKEKPTLRHLCRSRSEGAIAPQRHPATLAPGKGTSGMESWMDDVMEAVKGEGGGGRTMVIGPPNSRVPIPVIDLRREFKPQLDTPLELRELFGVPKCRLRCGVNYGVSTHSLKDSNAAVGKETMRTTSRKRAESVPETARRQSPMKRVVDTPPFPPLKLYSSFEVKEPQRPSAWAVGPKRRDLLADSPPVRRRIAKTETLNSEKEHESGDVASVLVEEVRLDEQRRPYVLIREVPCGDAAVAAQRNSVERLSRPRPVFIRRTDEVKAGK